MVFGTFDIVHMGHIHMFKQAREYGDSLVVAVARDVNAERVKGVGPLHTEQERLEFLTNIKIIDKVRLGFINEPYRVIKEENPDVIALGYDQKEYVDKLADFLMKYKINAEIVRLSPYRENRFKSNKIKKYIERVV